MEPDLEKYQFVANLPAEFESEEPFMFYSISNYKGQTALTLVKRITPESEIPGPVDIYISSALMDELTADAPIRDLNIYTIVEYASFLESTLELSRIGERIEIFDSKCSDVITLLMAG